MPAVQTDEQVIADEVAEIGSPEEARKVIGDSLKSADEIFKFSNYVHVGEGAADCEHGEDGLCTQAAHFHAWLRLPNQFQYDDLQRKGRAAKARMMRALRDPESDAYIVIEADMEELRRTRDKGELIDSMIALNHFQNLYRVMGEVEAMDEYATRNEDVARFQEIEAIPEGERAAEVADEYEELRRHGQRYMDEVQERIADIEEPKRRALEDLDLDAVVDLLREERILAEGREAFAGAYQRYLWYACTLRPVRSGHPQERVFKEVRDLDGAAPEIVASLRATFQQLESSLQRGLTGN